MPVMNVPPPETWSVAAEPVDHAASKSLLHDYLDELISRYFGRPAEEAEIAQEAGGSADLRDGRGTFLIARAGGTPVGCAGIRWLDPHVGELTRVYVAGPARRGGAGRRLIGAAEEAARQHGARRMLLNTRKDLHEAIALYTGLGYRPTAPYGDDPYAEVWLSKDLA